MLSRIRVKVRRQLVGVVPNRRQKWWPRVSTAGNPERVATAVTQALTNANRPEQTLLFALIEERFPRFPERLEADLSVNDRGHGVRGVPEVRSPRMRLPAGQVRCLPA